MTEEKIDLVKPSMDFVFKRVFGAESHKRVLVCLLNSILKGEPQIASIELDNSEIPRDRKDGKDVRLDIRAKTPEGTILNIEIQCFNHGELIHRSAFYQSRLMPEEVKSGDSYDKLPNIIQIWIADYPATKRAHHTNEIVYMYKDNGVDPIEIATEKFRTFIIELAKIEFASPIRSDMFSVWMAFIKDPESIPKEFLTIPEVDEAMKEIAYLSHDKRFREEYEARQRIINDYNSGITVAEEKGLAKGKAEGLAEGKAEGERKKARETAFKMLAKGLDLSDISEFTGLSIGEIEELKRGIR